MATQRPPAKPKSTRKPAAKKAPAAKASTAKAAAPKAAAPKATASKAATPKAAARKPAAPKAPAKTPASKPAAKAAPRRRAGLIPAIALGIIAAGSAIALFGRRLLGPGNAEHEAPDLALDQPYPGPEDRAPAMFRPDPTAAVPESEREGLRPASLTNGSLATH